MCYRCQNSSCPSPSSCDEARLSLGFDDKLSMIVGSMDGVPIVPLRLATVVKKLETNTTLKWDPQKKAIVFENEKFKKGEGSADQVLAADIASAIDVSDITGVGSMIEGGLASIALVDDQLQLVFQVPEPVSANEISQGFITYVENITEGSHYRIIKPTPGGTIDTLLIGHPNGSIEFAVPITSPIIVPLSSLTGNGEFTGAPAVSGTGTWKYQTMGTTQTVANTSKSEVEVELFFRHAISAATGRRGVYCKLVNGGTDFQTTFTEGVTSLKQETSAGGEASFRCILAPGEKCQFEFGIWETAAGNMTATIGSIDEDGEHAVPPVITVRRQI